VPLEAIDTSQIVVSNDSLGIVQYTMEHDSLTRRTMRFRAAWQAPLRYHVTMFPGAIRDVWGRVNDTMKLTFVVTQAEQYGVMKITVEGLDSLLQYIGLIKLGEKTIDTFQIKYQSAATIIADPMLPGKYILEVIEDLNQNGVWDTGDYSAKRQPEKKQIFTPDQLRAGWDLDTKISWK
jgi:hypothetical protein